ncbi:MAG: ice-binding family protein [Verrucomicrobiota bacterium]
MNVILAAAFMASHEALMAAGPAPVNLGSAGQFAILSGSGITTAGQAYTITGNVGTSPAAGSYEIDLVQAQVAGTIYEASAGGPAGSEVDPTLLTSATGDLTAAYNDAAGRTSTPTAPVIVNPGAAGNIGGLTLVPGLYKFTSSPASITGSDLNGA